VAGNVLARTQYVAASEGYDKEHFFSLRCEGGGEGYEVVGPTTPLAPAYNVLVDFPEPSIAGANGLAQSEE
jgi:hypothetical protein